MHDLAVVNGIRDDVVEGVGHEKPRNGSAKVLGDVVLLRERGAEFDHGNAHPTGFCRLVNELANARLANFAREIRFGADWTQSSGLLLSKAGAGDVEGNRGAHNESDEEKDFHVQLKSNEGGLRKMTLF